MSNRYSRQIIMIGQNGQDRLLSSSVLVIGAGGVGCPLLLYLAGSGVGKISIIDPDTVDISNLHRQILFTVDDLGKYKAIIAEERLRELNPNISISSHIKKLTLSNAKNLFQDYDLIIDGSDNFQTRYLVNDICCQLELPFVSASIYQSQVQIMQVNPKHACYRCVFPIPPPPTLVENCDLSGIIGATAGIAGSIAASIAIQMLLHKHDDFTSQLIKFNNNMYSTDKFDLSHKLDCPACINRSISWPALNYKLNIEEINLDDYLVIDLREFSEDRSKILSKSQQHIPFSSFLLNLEQLPNVKILFYCTRGIRSDYAAHYMRAKGIEASSVSLL
ncbi:MAG: ThiF family adenylyltransferase [Gammaproteobacteria bacterium]